MIAGHVEIFSLVSNFMDLLGMSKNTARTIAHNRAFLPAPLEELVEDFDIFFGNLVAIVVAAKSSLSDVLGAALEIGCDDVPPDPALRQMVRGREAPRERIGCSKEVDAVTPMPRFFVAIEIGTASCSGSLTGICAAC
jgi:hypothetical protein